MQPCESAFRDSELHRQTPVQLLQERLAEPHIAIDQLDGAHPPVLRRHHVSSQSRRTLHHLQVLHAHLRHLLHYVQGTRHLGHCAALLAQLDRELLRDVLRAGKLPEALEQRLAKSRGVVQALEGELEARQHILLCQVLIILCDLVECQVLAYIRVQLVEDRIHGAHLLVGGLPIGSESAFVAEELGGIEVGPGNVAWPSTDLVIDPLVDGLL
mmetsp:Transcript_122937/g.274629  ORF Transcript_122937/g.274629 Transcript_122937/m.274629 type:complete len:213 (+) Transcript_122937:2904-3542(+)